MKVCQGVGQEEGSTSSGGKSSSSSFRRYIVSVRSAIPEVHVMGCANDYELIISKVNEMVSTFGLDWWAAELLPVLNEFIKAINGQADKHFWKYMCNLNDRSGYYMPYSGWIQAFFPYIDDGQGNIVQNDFIGQWRAGYNEVMPPKIVKYPKKKFPTSISQTNVHVHLPEPQNEPPKTTHTTAPPQTTQGGDIQPLPPEPIVRKMTLKSGLVAVVQNKDTLAVSPVFGYFLGETQPQFTQGADSTSPEEDLQPIFVWATRYKK